MTFIIVFTFMLCVIPLIINLQQQYKETQIAVNYLINLTDQDISQEECFNILDKFGLDNWEQAGFSNNQPILRRIPFSIYILNQTQLPFKMLHFCDEDFICLNFNQTIDRVAFDLLKTEKQYFFAIRNRIRKNHEIEDFCKILDKYVLKFEKYWYKQDVCNNLEFFNHWKKWWGFDK